MKITNELNFSYLISFYFILILNLNLIFFFIFNNIEKILMETVALFWILTCILFR
jgi:hypothetical protein